MPRPREPITMWLPWKRSTLLMIISPGDGAYSECTLPWIWNRIQVLFEVWLPIITGDMMLFFFAKTRIWHFDSSLLFTTWCEILKANSILLRMKGQNSICGQQQTMNRFLHWCLLTFQEFFVQLTNVLSYALSSLSFPFNFFCFPVIWRAICRRPVPRVSPFVFFGVLFTWCLSSFASYLWMMLLPPSCAARSESCTVLAENEIVDLFFLRKKTLNDQKRCRQAYMQLQCEFYAHVFLSFLTEVQNKQTQLQFSS